MSLSESFFGFDPAKFIDCVYQSADDYVADGLDALEAAYLSELPATEKASFESSNDKFINILRGTFEKNIDMFELYAMRNVFVLNEDSDPALVTAVKKDIESKFVNQPKANKKQKLNKSGEFAMKDLTSDCIPSLTDIQTIDDEMKDLRKKLRLAKRRNSTLKFTMEHVEKTLGSAEKGEQEITDAVTGSEDLYERVSAVVMGKEGLEQLKSESKSLVADMGKSKMQDIENQKPKSLEEKFSKTKATIQTQSARDITNLTSILKR